MSNAVNRISILGAAAIAAMLFMSGCGESESARAARQLYEEAEACNIAGDPEKALVLLDSLQNTCKGETDWQRTAMKLRPTVMINASEKQIAVINDSIAMYESQYNAMQPLLRRIADARLVEPYMVDKATYNASFMNTTGLQPRVSEIGQLYFVSSANPGGLNHTGFTITCDGESVSAGPVPYDGELNYRINNSEVVTYSPEQSDQVGAFVAAHAGRPMSLTLTGGKSKNIKFVSKDADAIVNCYNYSQAIVKARQLAFERERLNRQIEIARSQAERLGDAGSQNSL